jgi:hypothetical protein
MAHHVHGSPARTGILWIDDGRARGSRLTGVLRGSAELFGGAGDNAPGSEDAPSRSFGFARALDASTGLS